MKGWSDCTWKVLRENYAEFNIYNADEVSVFYNLTCYQSMKFKEKKFSKLLNNRLTVLMGLNWQRRDFLIFLSRGKKPTSDFRIEQKIKDDLGNFFILFARVG